MKAHEFLNGGATPKRQSKLEPFQADLLELHSANLSLNKMIEFLTINGVSATKSTVSRFLATRVPQAQQGTSPREETDPVRSVSTVRPPTPRDPSMTSDSKRLSVKERHAIAEKQAAKFFPNRFAKTSDE